MQLYKLCNNFEINVSNQYLHIFQAAKPHYASAADLMSNIMHDTTVNHKNHLFDVNCTICSGKGKPPAAAAEPVATKEVPSKPAYAHYLGSPNSPLEPPVYPVSKPDQPTKHDVFGQPVPGFYSGKYFVLDFMTKLETILIYMYVFKK